MRWVTTPIFKHMSLIYPAMETASKKAAKREVMGIQHRLYPHDDVIESACLNGYCRVPELHIRGGFQGAWSGSEYARP
jgi:hypothetical protein